MACALRRGRLVRRSLRRKEPVQPEPAVPQHPELRFATFTATRSTASTTARPGELLDAFVFGTFDRRCTAVGESRPAHDLLGRVAAAQRPSRTASRARRIPRSTRKGASPRRAPRRRSCSRPAEPGLAPELRSVTGHAVASPARLPAQAVGGADRYPEGEARTSAPVDFAFNGPERQFVSAEAWASRSTVGIARMLPHHGDYLRPRDALEPATGWTRTLGAYYLQLLGQAAAGVHHAASQRRQPHHAGPLQPDLSERHLPGWPELREEHPGRERRRRGLLPPQHAAAQRARFWASRPAGRRRATKRPARQTRCHAPVDAVERSPQNAGVRRGQPGSRVELHVPRVGT